MFLNCLKVFNWYKIRIKTFLKSLHWPKKWHTIILKYVANRCLYEPTICGFKSLVAKFYTICVYDTFWQKKCGFSGSSFNSTCFCLARGFNSTCSCRAQLSPTRTCAIKTSSLTKTCAIKTSSRTKTCATRSLSPNNNTFLAQKCHKHELCKILWPNFLKRIV